MSLICTFYLGDTCFGLDVLQVQEILGPHAITIVPLAPPGVAGLINVRGQILATIDLRTALGVGPGPSRQEQMNLILRREPRLSFLVDRIGEVLDVDEELFERPPGTLRGEAREVVKGAYKTPHGLVLMLDAVRAIPLGEGL